MTFDLDLCESKIHHFLHYTFQDKELLRIAFTHKSYFHEYLKNKSKEPVCDVDPIYVSNGWGEQVHNERLEFLGDTVLDLVLSEALMKAYPNIHEGDLSKMRASLVNESTLYELACELEVSEWICLGKGELKTGGLQKPSILGSAIEALFGAIYVDQGFEKVKEVVLKVYQERISALDLQELFSQDYKTRLQEVSQKHFNVTPEYRVVEEEGPSHEKTFKVKVWINEDYFAEGIGNSKKQAAQQAAQAVLEKLNERI